MAVQPTAVLPAGIIPSVLALSLSAATATVFGQSGKGDSSSFLVGPQLRTTLEQPVTISLVDRPYREALRSVGKSYQIAIFLDRRLDPDRPITFSMRNRLVADLLTHLAQVGGGELVWIGPVAYIGPEGKAWQMLAAAEICHQMVDQFPPRERAIWQATTPLSWPDFSTPRELLMELLEQIGWQLGQPEAIPHDLWPAVELPPLTMSEKLALLTVPFDLRPVPEINLRVVKLEEFPPQLRWQRTYPWPLPTIAGAEALRRLIPAAEWEVRGRWLLVRGGWNEHKTLLELAQAPRRKTTPPEKSVGERRYTIRAAKGRFESVMRQLASALDLEIRFDEEALYRAGISPDTFVSFSVENATREELLRAATEAAGCTFRIEGNVLFIFPERR